MNDTISRLAAIDAMTNYFARWAEYTAWSKTVKAMVETAQEAAREMLKKLPSAQPEIIRCKDCKYFELNHFENVKGCPIPLIVAHEICTRWGGGSKTSENGYCFLAEREET